MAMHMEKAKLEGTIVVPCQVPQFQHDTAPGLVIPELNKGSRRYNSTSEDVKIGDMHGHAYGGKKVAPTKKSHLKRDGPFHYVS